MNIEHGSNSTDREIPVALLLHASKIPRDRIQASSVTDMRKLEKLKLTYITYGNVVLTS